ncbi:MAG: DUF2934 domain-containing protein [Vicinamibacterales bacterium]
MKESRQAHQDRRSTPPKEVVADTELSYDPIARRAYELYEARGRADGHDLEDWLNAELELRRKTE